MERKHGQSLFTWAALGLVPAGLVYLMWRNAGGPGGQADLQRWLLFAIGVEIAVVLTGGPLVRHITSGWQRRYEGFRNSIPDAAVLDYMSRFWLQQLNDANDPAAAGRQFDKLYRDQFGRRVYIAPSLILLAATFVCVALAVQSGVDACWDGRCLSADTPSRGNAVLFAPLGGVLVPQVAVAAIAGAALFVVSDMVVRVGRRTLTAPDIYVYALRMAIAVPMGLAVGGGAHSQLQPLIAFGLGAFPLDALQRMVRQRTYQAVGLKAEAEVPSQPIKLAGVTMPIALSLAAAGIDSIEQLVGTDPVLLAIRTGLELPFVLRLIAQAVVRIRLGGGAGKLTALGLSDACSIASFVERLRGDELVPAEPQAVPAVPQAVPAVPQAVPAVPPASAVLLTDARRSLVADQTLPDAERVPSEATVRAVFEQIADDPFTQLLVRLEPQPQ